MKGGMAELSVDFSIAIVAYYQWLATEKKEFVMSKQILRSGTSIGANIHEADYAVSKADFIAKSTNTKVSRSLSGFINCILKKVINFCCEGSYIF